MGKPGPWPLATATTTTTTALAAAAAAATAAAAVLLLRRAHCPENVYFVGVDLGATNAKAGVVRKDGEIISTASKPLGTGVDSHAFHRVVEAIVAVTLDAVDAAGLAWTSIRGVGVGTPGHVHRGVVHAAANFPEWAHAPLGDAVAHALRCPVFVLNDADAAILAERWVGEAKGSGEVAMVTLGTGIGVGVVSGGQLVQGSRGLIEAGHSIVDSGPSARLCGCGQKGCIEAYASARSVAARAREVFAASGHSGPSVDTLSAADVFAAARRGDELASRIVDETARWLAVFCVNVSRFYDPDTILVGGGMADAGEYFLSMVRQHFSQLRWTVLPDTVSIKAACLGRHSGIVGAAALAASTAETGTGRGGDGQ
uniref:Glucokinase n=1 Tax=Rhizochromulina marina TaxID=1034831 RepID=A0A7S2RL15_9STRA|mmetsp:Transcript_17777/g.51912  ORF Transcript_17777/g.51912 Transcript_17777/m.51912 type:complete len:370 (+) Transcript_17777:90-1199(+)